MYATQQSARKKNEISTNLLSYVSTYKRQLFLQMHGIINLVPKNPQNENDFVCRKWKCWSRVKENNCHSDGEEWELRRHNGAKKWNQLILLEFVEEFRKIMTEEKNWKLSNWITWLVYLADRRGFFFQKAFKAIYLVSPVRIKEGFLRLFEAF